ncbi:TPA: hypothetical protein I8Z78_000365 [Legionella pneumophila]|nr:hypothetical protein [Legionella pneumophila]
MARSTFPQHVEKLIQFLGKPHEKANEDLALSYFRELFPNFTRQSDANRADGYVPGHFVLELKGKITDWYSGLFQGLAYKKTLDFTVIVVAAEGFLAIWHIEDIPSEIYEAMLNKKSAPNQIGKELASLFKHQKHEILKSAIWYDDQLYGLFLNDKKLVLEKIKSFENTLKSCRKVRQKITIKNFTSILKQMVEYFDPARPIKAVNAFYAMIYSWDQNSILILSNKDSTAATLSGEIIKFLLPDKRIRFKEFVENYYICLSENENTDDFFAQYDKAINVVDENFRVQNGIFFTNLDLSKFAMWLVKKNIPDLGKNYIVIDPACGSGNLVTNWRSPLQLRHKIVSEIEPELLYAVEKRMKGDVWHNGKFTVVPKVEEQKGLNFLDISAQEYIDIINNALKDKGLTFNKPLAFLCNPPYRGHDDQTAKKPNYEIHSSIIDIIGEEVTESYGYFLAQMKLICDHASSSGLPDRSILLLFTKSTWLINRKSFSRLRREIFSSFDFIDGMLVNGKEFFDLKGKFPIAFTIWSYRKTNIIRENYEIFIRDLTWIKKHDLTILPWTEQNLLNEHCEKLVNDKKSIIINFGAERSLIKNWIGLKRKDFIRNKRKAEREIIYCGGLPIGDERITKNKSTYGENTGLSIGFMDELTPCRVNLSYKNNYPWFRLNSQFMDSKRSRCFSGPPDNRGYCPHDYNSSKKAFLWFSLSRVFYEMGYPLWADAFEIWVPDIQKNIEDIVAKYSFSIGFAENECVETLFPANNPINGAIEINCYNPMNPIDPDSFWSKTLSPLFLKKTDLLPDRLVKSVNDLYDEWKTKFKITPEIRVSYQRPYFIGEGMLKPTAGIIQIRDYAKETNDLKLLDLYSNVQKLLKETKQAFYEFLVSESVDYFNSFPKTQPLANNKVIEKKYSASETKLTLAAMIVKSLASNSRNFGKTKFAKVFYITDMLSKHNLKTKYYREQAGPLDYSLFYNEQDKIEKLALERGYFTMVHTGERVHFIPGKNIDEIDENKHLIFGEETHELERVIDKFKKLNSTQAEVVATLFACWNDLLIDKKEITDDLIINEFHSNWHHSKTRFSKESLLKVLSQMKEHSIIPKGNKGHTHIKPHKK